MDPVARLAGEEDDGALVVLGSSPSLGRDAATGGFDEFWVT